SHPRAAHRHLPSLPTRRSSDLSQTRTVESQLRLAMRVPSGLKHTLVIKSLCPLRERSSTPLWASHTFTVLSAPPPAMRLPSGLRSEEHTSELQSRRDLVCRLLL